MYTMTLSDGSKLENLDLNGNNWISKKEVTEETFKDKLTTVTVTDGTETREYKEQVLIQISKMGNEYWFILGEQSEEDKLNQSITELQVALADVYEQMLAGGVK